MGDENYQPDPYASPQTDPGMTGQETDPQARQWAMFAHLAALVMFVGVPFGHIVGPLIVWMVKKDEMPFVDDQGKEAVNFQITMTIYLLIAGLSILVVIGVVLLPLVGLLQVIFIIIGAINANAGNHYRYPMTIRLIQ